MFKMFKFFGGFTALYIGEEFPPPWMIMELR